MDNPIFNETYTEQCADLVSILDLEERKYTNTTKPIETLMKSITHHLDGHSTSDLLETYENDNRD